MKRFISTLLIIVIFEVNASASKRTFTCGVLNANPTEYDAINFFNNDKSYSGNASVIFKELKIPTNISLFSQASFILQQNIVAVIQGSLSKTSKSEFLEVTGIPVIRLNSNSGASDQSTKLIQMSPGYRDYAHATLDILNKFGWKNVALVINEDRWPEAGYFHLASQRFKMAVNIIQLSKQDDNNGDQTASISKALEQIEHIQADVIILYTNKETTELLLNQKSCKHRKKWILQGKVSLNISSYKNNVVLALKLPYIESSTGNKLQQAAETNFATKDLAELAFDAAHVISQAVNKEPCSLLNESSISPKDTDAMLMCIRRVQLDGLTGPVQFDKNGKRMAVELEILNLRNNSFRNIGRWNFTKGAVLFEDILPNMENPSTKKDLQGKILRAVVVEDAPFIIKKKHEDGTFKYEGYCIDLLDELASNLKFTFEIYTSPDGLYGAERENGTWNGMIGELVSKRADVAVAALTITERREKVVDFSVPYMHYTDDFLMKKPSSNRPTDLLQFMNPFHYHVWIATLASVVTISIALFIINYFSPYGFKDNNDKGTSEEFSFFNSLWFALASLLQQGADNTPKSLSGRILTGSYWFCVMILVSTYTANLAAFLTVKNAQHSINNLEDIVEFSYHVAVLDSSNSYEFFKTSQYDLHKKIWHRVQTEGTIAKSTTEAIKLVREKDKFVFPFDGPLLRYVANRKPCDLTTVPGLTTAKGLALAFQANYSNLDDISLTILRLHENDFLDSLKRNWWDGKNECHQKPETMLSQKRIDLMSMLGVYVVMTAGMALAFLTLIAEILWNRRAKRNLVHDIKRNSSPSNDSDRPT